MAITTSYRDIVSKYDPRRFPTIEAFEEYHLRWLAETRQDTNYYTDANGVERKIPPVNHHPELKEYEVWREGYAATGEHSGASLLGRVQARNFRQACHILMCTRYLQQSHEANKPEYSEYYNTDWCYDPNKLTDWGCHLYWDEKQARKSFG